MNERLDAILKQLQGISAKSTLQSLQELIENPGSNLPLVMLLVAAVALLMLIVVLGLLFMLAPRRRRIVRTRRYRVTPEMIAAREAGMFAALQARALHLPPPGGRPEPLSVPASAAAAQAKQKAQEPKPPRKPSKVVQYAGSPLVLVLIVAAAVVGTYWASSRDPFCAGTCHINEQTVMDAYEIKHAKCVDCHEQRGLAGAVDNTTSRVRMAVSAGRGDQGVPGDVVVSSDGCLKCHEKILGGVTVTSRGIRVSHREFVLEGDTCTSCHTTMGHDRRVYVGGMSRCVVCHDAKGVSAECSTCHSRDPVKAGFSSDSSETVGSGEIVYPVVTAANRWCAGCHNMPRDCNPCHGLPMPHNDQFIKGGHARMASFGGRQTKCWKCHQPTDCNYACHIGITDEGGIDGHPDNWLQLHGAGGPQGGCPCHANRSKRTTPMCPLCH